MAKKASEVDEGLVERVAQKLMDKNPGLFVGRDLCDERMGNLTSALKGIDRRLWALIILGLGALSPQVIDAAKLILR